MMDNGDAVVAMAASITERAHDLIRDGWTKGKFYTKVDGAPVEFCVLGALELAMREMFPERASAFRVGADVEDLAQAFIVQEMRIQHGGRGCGSIPGFNDHPDTQLEHVLGVLRAAAERLWNISVQTEDLVGDALDLGRFTITEDEQEAGRQFLNMQLVHA